MHEVAILQRVMAKNSLEVILHPEIQEILDNFTAVMKVRVVFFGLSGQVLLRGRGEGNCAYCSRVQQCFGLEKCLSLDHAKMRRARDTGECQVYRCHGGLHEALMPILVAGEHLGYIMFGQFRKKGDLPLLTEKASDARLFRQCPVFSEEGIASFSGLLRLLVDYMLRRELIHADGNLLMPEIRQFIEEHFREDIRTSDVARRLGRSVSSISHFLQKEQGTSFKKLLLERRFRYVEEALRGQSRKSIKQLALEAGFSDASYFSRIYRKYRGKSASGMG